MTIPGTELVSDANGLVEASKETLRDIRVWMSEAPGRLPRIRIAGFG
jgi:hypothetical protein